MEKAEALMRLRRFGRPPLAALASPASYIMRKNGCNSVTRSTGADGASLLAFAKEGADRSRTPCAPERRQGLLRGSKQTCICVAQHPSSVPIDTCGNADPRSSSPPLHRPKQPRSSQFCTPLRSHPDNATNILYRNRKALRTLRMRFDLPQAGVSFWVPHPTR